MEEKLKHELKSEMLIISILLALVGGFLDAYTYITRGQVFANAQTGNIVLMAISFANNEKMKGLYYIVPIFMFVCGIFLVEFIKMAHLKRKKIQYKQTIVLVEIIIIIIIPFIPMKEEYNIIVNSIVSLISAIQIQTFRKLKGDLYASTMCTGNLRSMGDNLSKYIVSKDNKYLKIALKYLSVILSFIIGAVCGFFLIKVFNEFSILFTIILLVLVLLFLTIEKKKKGVLQ